MKNVLKTQKEYQLTRGLKHADLEEPEPNTFIVIVILSSTFLLRMNH